MNGEPRDREFFLRTRTISYTLDLAGNITFLNKAGELMSGYSCEEARRMNITEVVAPEFAAYIRDQIKRHVRERFGAVYEVDLITKDRRRVPLEVSTHVVLRDGRPVEIQGIALPSVVRSKALASVSMRCVDAGFVFGSLFPGLIAQGRS